jgi:hypothetical protein
MISKGIYGAFDAIDHRHRNVYSILPYTGIITDTTGFDDVGSFSVLRFTASSPEFESPGIDVAWLEEVLTSFC